MLMRERIAMYIKEFGSITTLEAFRDLGCTRLSEYIRQLKFHYKVGSDVISAKNRYGETTHFKKYYFMEEKNNDTNK